MSATVLNSKLAGGKLEGFEGEDYQNKKIKQFELSYEVAPKNLIRDSNYFDER